MCFWYTCDMQVVGAQDSVTATSALVSRLRLEAELLDQNDGSGRTRQRGAQYEGGGPVGAEEVGAATAAGGAAASSSQAAGSHPGAGGGTAWRVLVALDHAALRLRRNGRPTSVGVHARVVRAGSHKGSRNG